MLLSSIVRDMRPRRPVVVEYIPVWCGKDERAGLCPVLLDLGRGPSGENYYGSSQLHAAVAYGMRGIDTRA